MPQTCTVCSHQSRADIEAAIRAGTPYRTIAVRYGLSKTALLRHKGSGHKADHLATPGILTILTPENRLTPAPVIPHIPAPTTPATTVLTASSSPRLPHWDCPQCRRRCWVYVDGAWRASCGR